MARERAKANTKTRNELAQATRATLTSTRARIVAERDIGRKIAGDQEKKQVTTATITTTIRRKARTTRTVEAKAKAKANR